MSDDHQPTGPSYAEQSTLTPSPPDGSNEWPSSGSRSRSDPPGNGSYFIDNERSYNNTSWTYRFPADQEEVVRQDRQHWLLQISLPGLYRGPVEDVLTRAGDQARILDLGCGTGIWLAEMAEQWPRAEFVGVDIMPLQHDNQPPNCTYLCVNVDTGMDAFADASFDVVHLRQMLYCFTDCTRVLQQCRRVLRPGGVLLIHESQFTFYSAWEGWTPSQLAPAEHHYAQLMKRAFAHRGVDLDVFLQLENMLVEVGFRREDIDSFVHYRCPCPEDLESERGQNEAAHAVALVKASRLMLLEAGGITAEQFADLADRCEEEVYGQSRGPAGPSGGQGLLSPWGYWWVSK